MDRPPNDTSSSSSHSHRILVTGANAGVGLASVIELARRGHEVTGGGRVVNVSSVLGNVPSPLLGWYAASKQALEAVSDAMRIEVARDGIHVVLVEVGGVRTGAFDTARKALDERQRAGTLYGAAYRMWGELTERAEGLMSDPASVAGVIATAVDAPRPNARYRVGLDARLLECLDRLAPGALRDVAARTLLRL